MKRICIIYFILVFGDLSNAQTVKILFDASKAESAGNADWVIDADLHNIGFTNGPAVVGLGDESNPQRFPSPAQATVTSSTLQSYWQGGISAWGIDCAKQGYIVESLPYNGQITYGNAGNVQDLSNYNIYIACEPNIVFTSAEKTAILNFVQNGGGLYMVCDHDQSDRNNDGWDSPHIWNDLMQNNSVITNPFGFTIDYNNFSQTSFNIPLLPLDSLLHGPYGNVTEVQWTSGTTATMQPSVNSNVQGIVYKTGSSFGNNNVMVLRSRYGNGKVVFMGDSSPCDDGTGDPNDVLYDGWITDAAGNHQKLVMNATIWLATNNSANAVEKIIPENDIDIFPVPAKEKLNVISHQTAIRNIEIETIYGEKVYSLKTKKYQPETIIDLTKLLDGVYIVNILTSNGNVRKKLIKQ
jgi:hypothetical protein